MSSVAFEKLYVLPMLLSLKEVEQYAAKTPVESVAIRAYLSRLLYQEYGLRNKAIRKILSVRKVYQMTHLLRVGLVATDDQVLLWHNNMHKLTLGHMRVLCGLSAVTREKWMREVLAKGYTVKALLNKVHGNDKNQDTDIAAYERAVSEKLGRGVRIEHSKSKGSGHITLSYSDLDDLDELLKRQGFTPEQD